MNKYKVILSSQFNKELNYILSYLYYNLKISKVAENLYTKIFKRLATLEYLPEICSKLYYNNYKYRKLLINKYIIIYEVNIKTKKVCILHIFHSSQNYFNLL